ncbi:PREDICTED: putative nuclease HARBI1 [Rhagoletis zephyria]|uniref:putative nuclease HARBI1 n=1 Tax=Rhagoletis zephyria TaxID=28612 RepID=UPI0008117B72|nr:PREDICTED: putative nuclease HARBI1 [Rhagoletis zephyria]
MAFQFLGYDAEMAQQRQGARSFAAERALLREVDSPFDLDEGQFKRLYRLTPNLVYEIIDKIGSRLERKYVSALSAEKQVLAALRFYATGCYQRPVGEQWGLSMSQSSISRSIHRVTDAINETMFMENVRYPMTVVERQVARSIFSAAREPLDGAIGAIDCTHIAVIGPKDHEEAYINHHGYHSINVQMVCDPNLKILNVNARFPGARHDAYIWNASAVPRAMKRAYDRGDHNTFLIGDLGYPLEPWLMTPLSNQREGSPQFRYNEALCKARNCVERLFGVLKGTWRCLSKQRVLMYEPGFAGRIVNSCAALHNMRLNTVENNSDIQSEDQIVEAVLEEDWEESIHPSALAKRMHERLIAAKFT